MMETTEPTLPGEPTAKKEMPRYECHKKVWALKIKAADVETDGGTITPEDDGFAPFRVNAEWWSERFKPSGDDLGYYVVYDGGYKSWSPSDAFEEGYTLIDQGAPTTTDADVDGPPI